MERLACCHKIHMKQLDTNIKCFFLARVAFPPIQPKISALQGAARRGEPINPATPHDSSHPIPPLLHTMVVTTIYITRHGVSHPLTLPGTPLSISGPHTLPPHNSSGATGPSIRKRAPTQPPPPVLPAYHQTLL